MVFQVRFRFGYGALFVDVQCYYPDGSLAHDMDYLFAAHAEVQSCGVGFPVSIPDGMDDLPTGVYKIKLVAYRDPQDYSNGIHFEIVEYEHNYP